MKDGVDRSEGIGELKGEGVSARLGDDVIGTKIHFRDFFEGQVVWKCLVLMKTLLLIFESGARDQCLSAVTWHHF